MVSNHLLFLKKLREKNALKVIIRNKNTNFIKLVAKFKYWKIIDFN
jgi:hypothetical protein